MVFSANCQYFNFKMFNLCLGEVVMYVNVFGSRRYIRDCGKLNTCNVILMDNLLGEVSIGFLYRTVFSRHLGIFEEYGVDLLKQFMNTNQFMHGYQQRNILILHGT